MAAYSRENTTNNIIIVKTENVENYTEYVIEVRIGGIHWLVNHRYSEFSELHEQLVAEHGIDKKLLPPKKVFGNTSESFIQKRRSGLERYLQHLLKQFERIPFQLAIFLQFQKYEINGVTQILAETLFSRGDALLEKESTCSMDPLQLHSITERMTKPETVVGHHTRDIGHILDFVTHLPKLRVIGTDKSVGTSNLNMNNLGYSLAMFKSIKYLELVKCNVTQINGLDHIRKNVEKLKIKKSMTSIQEFLTHNVRYWEDEAGEEESQSNITWPKLTWVDMSENNIIELPESMRYLERAEYLDLHDNYLTTIENLQSVSYLTHLDVSINRIERLSDLHLRLGNVKTINLSGNKLETLEGFSKLYSLEYLDVSSNQISQVVELQCLGLLPLLETLILTGNPVTIIPDYRIQVLKVFGDRAKEVTLDHKKGNEKELDTVAVLIALDHSKQPSSTAKGRQAKADSEIEAGPSSQASAAGTEGSDLSAPLLQEKLENLRLTAGNEWLNKLDETTVPVETRGPRFDSPFNSPARSSMESENQFHSLSSTPLQSDEVIESADNKAKSALMDNDRITGNEAVNVSRGAKVTSDNGSSVSSPSASFSIDSDNPDEEPSSKTLHDGSAPSEENQAASEERSALQDISVLLERTEAEGNGSISLEETKPVRDEFVTSTEATAARDDFAASAETMAIHDGSAPSVETTAIRDDSALAAETTAIRDDSALAAETTAVRDDFAASAETMAIHDGSAPSAETTAVRDDSALSDEIVIVCDDYALSTETMAVRDGSTPSDGRETAEAPSLEQSDVLSGHQRPPITLNIQAADDGKEFTGISSNPPPQSPLNVSIDVVDHLEKCLATIPKTLKPGSSLDQLVNLDGEELLNMFYHDTVIRRVGNRKEELCHAMWTSLLTFTNPEVEQPCLVLLSNQATYFIRAGKGSSKYTITNISHSDLQQVSIGIYDQFVQLSGRTQQDCYCCVTRDPILVRIFVTRITFIVDTDYVKQNMEESKPDPLITEETGTDGDLSTNSEEEEESIYDTKRDDTISSAHDASMTHSEHPSGVGFVCNEEKYLDDMREFIMSCRGEDKSLNLPLTSVDCIFVSSADNLNPSTMVLVADSLYLVKESYLKYPPDTSNFVLKQSIKLKDVRKVLFKKELLQFELTIGADILAVDFCSITLAQSFHSKYLSASSD